MRRVQIEEEEESEVNLTPMLDVVFIMLIFFIVTASFVKESALDLPSKDDSDKTETNENQAILVQVDSQSRIFLQQRQIDIGGLRANLERVKAENPNASLVIQAHPESKNGRTVEIMDKAELAGIENVQFASADGG